jgi:hypothetical protein
LEYTFWLFYSLTNPGIPDLYLQVTQSNDDCTSETVSDPRVFTEPTLHSILERDEDRAFFLTKKEHPILKGRITYYLHECKVNEMFQDGKDINRVAKWASVVFPQVFGIEVVNIEVMAKIMKV